MFLPDLFDGLSGISLFKNGHDLRLGELRLAQGDLLAQGGYWPERIPF